MSVILETKQLCKFYGAGENQVKAVNQVDIQIEQGEFVAIVGKSGSGKSTLLHMLGGLDTPTKGSVTLAGKDLYRMKEDALAVFRRRKIGFVFQAFNLVSSVNVWENIVLPLGLDGRKVDEAYVNDIIATLGIENRIYNLPNQLSGGQQQRVAIARALVNRPEIIFADEPTGNLDSKTSDEVIALLKMTAKKYGQTIVMITHGNQTKIPCPFSQGEFRVYISRLQFAGHIDDFRKYCTGISNQQSPCRERRIPHFGYSRKAEYQRYSKQISLSGIRRTKTALCLCKSNYQQPEALTGR